MQTLQLVATAQDEVIVELQALIKAFLQNKPDAIIKKMETESGVDNDKRHIADRPFSFASVAGYAWHVMDDSHSSTDQTIKKGRFADIGTTDDGDFKSHGDSRSE